MATWNTAIGFLDGTLNKSYDMDGYYGKQCWDYGDYFWLNQVHKDLSTGGTGEARGCWTVDLARRHNAGTQFELITDRTKLQRGDWVILNTGKYGHVGCVYSVITTGQTVCLQSQNQGTIRTKVTRINISLNTFLGAFRYKEWNVSPQQFLPEKGYWKEGDRDPRIDKLCRFYADNFYGYFCRSKAESHKLLDGNYFGPNCRKWTVQFQKRTGIKADGCVGPLTYDKLKRFGFAG